MARQKYFFFEHVVCLFFFFEFGSRSRTLAELAHVPSAGTPRFVQPVARSASRAVALGSWSALAISIAQSSGGARRAG